MIDVKHLIETLASYGSKLYIVEVGAGVPLASMLLNTPGASKVVYHTECPYGSAIERYNVTDRMVSESAVLQIVETLKTSETSKYNTIVATSFQIPSNDSRIPHGWVAISRFTGLRWVTDTCHLTFEHVYTGKYSRSEAIDAIGEAVATMLANGNMVEGQTFVDIHRHVLEQQELGTLITFKDGVPVRFEDHTRGFDNLIIYKGSFNPVHVGHQKIAEDAKNRIENSKVVFAISRATYGKGWIPNEDLMTRIKAINDLGYLVVVFDNGFFFDNKHAIGARFAGNVQIALGVDTFNRVVTCYDKRDFSSFEGGEFAGVDSPVYTRDDAKRLFNANFGSVKFLVYGRRQNAYLSDLTINFEYIDFDVDVSSTQIRELLNSGNPEAANNLIAKVGMND